MSNPTESFLSQLKSRLETQSHSAEFIGLVAERLAVGEQEYGDRSPSKPFADLNTEIAEELLDVAGWACQVWRKLAASNSEAIHSRHPRAVLADAMVALSMDAFTVWLATRDRLAKICKELDARA